ncbi:MAG: hypothetical protein LBS80_03880, partial [Tannerella sp.]|nr:hypothetical protein [Tannerella sp.]
TNILSLTGQGRYIETSGVYIINPKDNIFKQRHFPLFEFFIGTINDEAPSGDCKMRLLGCKMRLLGCKMRLLDCKMRLLDCKMRVLDCKMRVLDCKMRMLDSQ